MYKRTCSVKSHDSICCRYPCTNEHNCLTVYVDVCLFIPFHQLQLQSVTRKNKKGYTEQNSYIILIVSNVVVK